MVQVGMCAQQRFKSVYTSTNTVSLSFPPEETLNKKGGNDQESIQSSFTPDPGYHM